MKVISKGKGSNYEFQEIFLFIFAYNIYSILFIILRDISEYPGKVMFSEALFLEGERNSKPKVADNSKPGDIYETRIVEFKTEDIG